MTSIAPFYRHVLINDNSQGAQDWLYSPQSSIMDSLLLAGAEKRAKSASERKVLFNMFSSQTRASILSPPSTYKVRVYPEGLEYDLHAGNVLELANALTKDQLPADHLSVESMKQPQIYICGHMARDTRCGFVAPVLHEYMRNLILNDSLYNHWNLNYISHMGGHKFAGNVLFYMPEGDKGYDTVWYGRVTLENIEAIMAATHQQKVVPELMRYSSGRYNQA